MRLLHVEHPDGGGPGVFGDVAAFETWRAWDGGAPPAGPFDAVVLYGAATNIGDPAPWLDAEIAWVRDLLAAGVPLLGLCFGAQVIAAACDAPVVRSSAPEIGWARVSLTPAGRADPVLAAMGDDFLACQWHSYTFGLPTGASLLASSDVCAQAFRVGSAWGVQFHPEVDRATYARWIDGYEKDPDAVALGVVPEVALAELDARVEEWNARGRALFSAFLAQL